MKRTLFLICAIFVLASCAHAQTLADVIRWQAGKDAPETPTAPVPASASTAVPLPVTLTWASAGATQGYDVYFGTSSSPAKVTTITAASYQPTVAAGTKYFWKIVSHNPKGTATGPLWSFTTAAAVIVPPPPMTTCQDPAATNIGGPLPCTFPAPTRTLLQPADLTCAGVFAYDSGGMYALGPLSGQPNPPDGNFSRGLAVRIVNGQTRVFTMPWQGQAIMEMAVPSTLGPCTAPSTAPIAPLVKNWGNVQNVNWLTAQAGNTQGFGLFWDPIDQRLYWSYGNVYNAVNIVDPSIGYSTLNDATGVQTPNGPWIVSPSAKYAMGGLVAIPAWFASQYTNGRRLGPCCGGYWSIVATGPASMGPALGAIDPPTAPAGSAVPHTELLNYPFNATPYTTPDRMHRSDLDYTNAFDGWDPKNGVGYYDWTDLIWQGGAWVDTPTRSGLLVFTTNGNGPTFYQNSTLNATRASHWINEFDPADLALVAQGKKQPWEIQPAAQWAIQFPGLTYPLAGWADEPGAMITGVTFEPTQQRLYVAVRFAGANGATVVYVYPVP